MSNIQLIKELRKILKKQERKDLAEQLGISLSYLCEILNGTRQGNSVAKKLGFKMKWSK
jgi:transcriptional regulator with XRE-family HTH domain